MYSPPIEDMAVSTAEHFSKAGTTFDKDAISAWDEYVKYHLSHNGLDDKCKYWFILGYNSNVGYR